jgi:hypothetical protein
MTNNNNKKDYDPADKWRGPTSSYADAKFIKDMIKNGVLKNDVKETSKKET